VEQAQTNQVTTPTKSKTTDHSLNKDRFQKAMESRGWRLTDAHGWTAPERRGNTRKTMEKDWIDSILEAIDCPHEKE